MDPQVFREIELDQLFARVKSYKERGWRLANLCASTVGDKVELLYSFSTAEELENLFVLIDNGQPVPAVSKLYPNAFFFENEARDLYGVKFKDSLLDYDGRFYSPSIPTPLNPSSLEAQQYLEESEQTSGADRTDTSDATEAQEENDVQGDSAHFVEAVPTTPVPDAPDAGVVASAEAGEVETHG